MLASPLRRAVQTAEIINKYHNLPIEIDGAWPELQTDGRVEASIWHDLFDFDKEVHLANNEPLNEFFDRVYAAIDALKTKYKPTRS